MALTFVARKRLKASQFALNSASCLAKSPASAIHGFGVRWRNARIAFSNSPRRIGRTKWVRTYTLLQKNGPLTGPGFFWRRGWDWVTRCASSPLTCSCAAALVERGSEHPYHTRPEKQKAPFGGHFGFSGGEGGIRTHGTDNRTLDFESSPFDHSGTSPTRIFQDSTCAPFD